MKDRHLVISLNANSWGSATTARVIADDLVALGDEVSFLARECMRPVLCDADFRCNVLPDHMGPLMGVYLENMVNQTKPTTVILADYFGNANFLSRVGVNPDCMLPSGAVTFAVDAWDCERTGYEVDTTCGATVQIGPGGEDGSRWHRQFESISHKLKPVPMVGTSGSTGCFCTLGAAATPAKRERLLARQRLGFCERDKLLLFCTNAWQHPRPGSAFERQAEALPRLLAQHVSCLGESAHLVHVGPQPFDLRKQLNHRYHWLPPLAPSDFDAMLAGVDLMVSANISATTIAKAMVYEVPVAVLQNSVSASSRDEAEAAAPKGPSPWLCAWLEDAVPLVAFSLWPIGFYRFLAPLLRDNPYVAALQILEILDEQRTQETLAALLFDPGRREEQMHRQALYLGLVRSLPTGAQAIKALC
jgi:hypothetical protein